MVSILTRLLMLTAGLALLAVAYKLTLVLGIPTAAAAVLFLIGALT